MRYGIPTDIVEAMSEAWDRLLPELKDDPGEVERRLARRRTGLMLRPLRPYCLAVRAADQRIIPYYAAIVPEHAMDLDDPRHPYEMIEHTVRLDTKLVRMLCAPKWIDPPGERAYRIAERLGSHYGHIGAAMRQGVFSVNYKPGLGGRRGKPVPLLYFDGLLDPNGKQFRMPDPMWGTHEAWNVDRMPMDVEQEVVRRPVYRRFNGRHRFVRWVWACPACERGVENLYFPLPPIMINFESFLPRGSMREFEVRERGLPCFACTRCHNIRQVTRLGRLAWNVAIAAFSGGLLYGSEVKPPAWFAAGAVRRRAKVVRKCPPRAPGRRAEVLKLLLETEMGCRRMAREVGIRFTSVYEHVRRIYREHGVSDRAGLRAAVARRRVSAANVA